MKTYLLAHCKLLVPRLQLVWERGNLKTTPINDFCMTSYLNVQHVWPVSPAGCMSTKKVCMPAGV